MKRFALTRLAPVAFALALIGLWQVLADLRLISPIFFPSPARAFAVLEYRLADGSLWVNSSQGGGTKDTWVVDKGGIGGE